ncbi:MAG: AI-2E family transporter [Gemmatimonadota bacterium]|jgi:predicted PurR-regulated permease PerM|nr:MAG: AI-2E family transporter [Gemmatimonadota bacterium]
MAGDGINPQRFQASFLLLLVGAISLLFFAMVRHFLMAVFLAAIASGLLYGLYKRCVRWFGGRASLASIATILLFIFLLLLPLSAFLGIVTAQALEVTQAVGPWLQQNASQPDILDQFIDRLPFAKALAPFDEQITVKVGELAEHLGSFAFSKLAAATRGTVMFFFLLFVMLYAMFFFLKDGPALLNRILYYMPLSAEAEDRLVRRFVSVTRATIKGTLVIGVVQGGLAGAAFAVAGIPAAAFWGTVMAVLSILPGVGIALIWVPAAIYLAVIGKAMAAVGLTLWCALVAGTVDNLLRPRLVGRDTQMPDLLILLGTLGGLALFGAVGIVVGPIVAALFVTVWQIYGETFKGVLPQPGSIPATLDADVIVAGGPGPGEDAR